jgi:hypothetical protein
MTYLAALAVGLPDCSGPVSASDCAVVADSHGTGYLQATLTNHTAKVMTHVGVLVYQENSLIEYEFEDTLRPFEVRPRLSGTEYASGANPSRGSMRDRSGPVYSCWARIAQFADGTGWAVSPL